MDQKPTVVHVTHEAAGKIGGIGAVLEGMFTSHAYNNEVGRTVLVCPLFSTEGGVSDRRNGCSDSEVGNRSATGLMSARAVSQLSPYSRSHRIWTHDIATAIWDYHSTAQMYAQQPQRRATSIERFQGRLTVQAMRKDVSVARPSLGVA